MSAKHTLTTACLLISILALSACGGGGGGGGTVASVGPTAVMITAANSAAVAGEGFRGSALLTGTGSASGSAVVGVVTTSTGSRFSLVDFASGQLETVAASQFNTPGFVTGAVITQSAACQGGGTVSRAINDADNNNRFSTGDTVTVTFTNCVESGFTFNGGFSVTNVMMTGTPGVTPARSVSATFTFTNLGTQKGTSIETVNGDVNLTDSTVDGIAFDLTIAGNNLSFDKNGQTITLSSFSESLSENRSTNAFSFKVKGIVTSSRLGGFLTIDTPTPFTGMLGTLPSSGVLKVTAAKNSSLTLTALSTTSVRIDVDANGDGVFESSTIKTWSEIEAA